MSFQRTLFYTYNPGTTLTYGVFKDQVNIRGFITTSGSNTTTTATETSGDGSIPFAPVGVGDLIWVTSNLGVGTYRLVTTKTSNTSIVVNSAWTLTATVGQSAKFMPWISGTAAGSGWFPVTTFKSKTVKVNVDTLGSASVTISIEGKMSENDATGYAIFTKAYTATGQDVFTITEPWSYMRVGFKDAGDAGTDSVSAWFVCSDTVSL